MVPSHHAKAGVAFTVARNNSDDTTSTSYKGLLTTTSNSYSVPPAPRNSIAYRL